MYKFIEYIACTCRIPLMFYVDSHKGWYWTLSVKPKDRNMQGIMEQVQAHANGWV